MKLPKISVVTPSFNQGRFIKETIESVLSQNYPHLEYWVVDGGSTDETVSILKSYKSKIRWLSEKDKGQTDAINKGMRLATGEVLCYLNSDDTFFPHTLEVVGKYFSTHPQAVWVTGDYQVIDGQGKEIHSFIRSYKTFFRNIHQDQLLYVLNYINQPSTFWRAAIHKKIGYFDNKLRYCMDYDFWLRLLNVHSPVVLPNQLSQFRVHNQSKSGSQYQKQFAEERQVLERYTQSTLLRTLHKLHSAATVQAYNWIK